MLGPGGPDHDESGLPKVKDALGYLERVKKRYAEQPEVYNQFLEIMKEFKSQQIDTEGVIMRVKDLFRGNHNLILGFNQFLPQGYKIEVDDDIEDHTRAAQLGHLGVPGAPAGVHLGNPLAGAPAAAGLGLMAHPAMAVPAPAPAAALPPGAAAAPGMAPAVEFDHAVQYVAKIKKRFQNQPEVYSEFLEILQDYQAKRAIDHVYARVQHLFGNQPDLLAEFKYFLPDNTKGGAAEMGGDPAYHQAHLLPPQQGAAGGGSGKPRGGARGKRGAAGAQGRRGARGRNQAQQQQQQAQQHQQQQQHLLHGQGQQPQYHPAQPLKPKRTVMYPADCELELHLFERIKQTVSRPQWVQFLKCLNLFTNQIITRQQLVRIVEDVLGKGDLNDRFRKVIGYDEWEEQQHLSHRRSNYFAFIASNDLSNCKEASPSYRMLPSRIRLPPCSGRSALAEEVLNNTYVSIPTGSEDFSFKTTRRNQYEENLFKCEDERYELDMIIENNRAALRVLMPIAEQLATMSPAQKRAFQLPLETLENRNGLHVLHFKAIQRIYGEQGQAIVSLLHRSPAHAVPIIIERLTQKEKEWCQARDLMKKQWRKMMEENFHRSLDHRSFYFKQDDKKARSTKALVAELHEAQHRVFGHKPGALVKAGAGTAGAGGSQASGDSSSGASAAASSGSIAAAAQVHEDVRDSELLRNLHQQEPLYDHCLRFDYSDPQIHAQIYDVVMRAAQNLLDEPQRHALRLFWLTFIHQFFNVELPPEDDPSRRFSFRGKRRSLRSGDSDTGSQDDDDDLDPEGELPGAPGSKPAGKASATASAAAVSKDAKDDSASSPSASPSAARGSIPETVDSYTPIPCAGVKPLHISMPAGLASDEAGAAAPDDDRHTRPANLFFGSSAFYVLFRLHRFLYERLAIAKVLAYSVRRGDLSSKSRSARDAAPLTGDERFEKLWDCLLDLVDEVITSSAYEDALRGLIGSSGRSYILFTLDRLIAQLVKHTASVILEKEVNVRLLALYQYEAYRRRHFGVALGAGSAAAAAEKSLVGGKRPRSAVDQPPSGAGAAEGGSPAQAAQLRRMYQRNCATLLGDFCQMEYFMDTKTLGIGVVEGPAHENAAVDLGWRLYLQQLSGSAIAVAGAAGSALAEPLAASPAQGKPQLPFLRRNVRSHLRAADGELRRPPEGAAKAAALEAWLQRPQHPEEPRPAQAPAATPALAAYVGLDAQRVGQALSAVHAFTRRQNDLSARVCSQTYSLSFAEATGSQDVFVRQRALLRMQALAAGVKPGPQATAEFEKRWEALRAASDLRQQTAAARRAEAFREVLRRRVQVPAEPQIQWAMLSLPEEEYLQNYFEAALSANAEADQASSAGDEAADDASGDDGAAAAAAAAASLAGVHSSEEDVVAEDEPEDQGDLEEAGMALDEEEEDDDDQLMEVDEGDEGDEEEAPEGGFARGPGPAL